MKNFNFSRVIALLLIAASLLTLTSCAEYNQKPGNDAVSAAMEYTPEIVEAGCRAESYTMDITLDVENKTVSGSETVLLTNKTDAALSEVCFRLYSCSITDESAILAAANAESGKEYIVAPEEDDSVVFIKLDGDEIAPGASISIKLDFISSIPYEANRYGYMEYDDGTIFNLTFCFPQIAFLSDGKWFDAEYYPYGEAVYNEMSNYYVTFNAPADYVVMSSGKSVTNNGVTVIEANNVREMAITACNFASIETRVENGVTFNILKPQYPYYETEFAEDIYDLLLETAVESTALFSEKVGPYIYDELDIIPTELADIDGMEMPGIIYVTLPKSTPDELSFVVDLQVSVVATAHEVGHEWFYCAVGDDQFNETWLDESFTSYLEKYFCRNTVSALALGSAFAEKYYDDYFILEEHYTSGNRIAYINLPADIYGDEASDYPYCYGENFLYALEEQMGEEDFFIMLSDWYNENINGIVEGYAFINHLMEYDSSDEVKEIVNQYISEDYLK